MINGLTDFGTVCGPLLCLLSEAQVVHENHPDISNGSVSKYVGPAGQGFVWALSATAKRLREPIT